jgi:hypothetical protein
MSFVYHANALAFGGMITKPCCEVIPSLGSVVLAPSGGEGSAIVGKFNYKGIISFDEASVYVAGSQKGRYRNTVATVQIRNLNLFNVVRIDTLCTRVTSEHVAVDEKEQSECEDEPSFTFEGSMLEDLRIGGRRVDVRLDTSVFSRYPTHSGFVKAFSGDTAAEDKLIGVESRGDATPLVDRYRQRFGWNAAQRKEGVPVRRGAIRCSLVDAFDLPETDEDFSGGKKLDDSMTAAEAAAEQAARDEIRRENDKKNPVRCNGYIVRVADFGTLAIGEVILKENQRTINMLRFNLGSPNGGSGTASSGTTNGTDMYP